MNKFVKWLIANIIIISVSMLATIIGVVSVYAYNISMLHLVWAIPLLCSTILMIAADVVSIFNHFFRR